MNHISEEKASAFKLDSEEDILLLIQNITFLDSIKDEDFVSVLEELGFQVFPSGKPGVRAKYRKGEWEIVHAPCHESGMIPKRILNPETWYSSAPGYLVYNSLTKKVVARFYNFLDAVKLVIVVS